MTNTIKERPILFSSPMILALLDGRKTQTRRIIKPQPLSELDFYSGNHRCPYGESGDRLYVRETWAIADNIHGDQIFYYKADNPSPKDVFDVNGFKWKPSIHMPRMVSRIRLEIVNISVERLQDISGEDAKAEGIESCQFDEGIFYRNYSPIEVWEKDPIFSYRTLWESINGRNSWNLNPWVWVVCFKKLEAVCQ